MKRLFFIFIFFTSNITFAQQDTLYFNADWKLCKKETASFYRIAEKQAAGGYIIQDTYIKTNIPQMIAFSATVEPTYFIGKCSYYFPNGKLSSEGYYSENVKTGLWRDWSADGKDSTVDDYGIAKRKKITFIPQDISKEQKIKDSIITYNSVKHSAWEASSSELEKDKQGFAFSVRAKFATFFIIEDTYFMTYTLGTEFAYNRHSIGVDYTWFRWRYETDNSNDVGMFSQYELRRYIQVDYKYTFLEFKRSDIDLYFNAFCKIGKYKMWYDKYSEYDFGIADMTFLESKTAGTYNEPGAGLGIRKYAEDSGFGIDCSANVGYQSTDYNERTYLSATETDFKDGVKNQKFVFDMRVNLIYNFGR